MSIWTHVIGSISLRGLTGDIKAEREFLEKYFKDDTEISAFCHGWYDPEVYWKRKALANFNELEKEYFATEVAMLREINVPRGSECSCQVTVFNDSEDKQWIVHISGDLRDVGDEYLKTIQEWWFKAMRDLGNIDNNWEDKDEKDLPPVLIESAVLTARVEHGKLMVLTQDEPVLPAPEKHEDMNAFGGWFCEDPSEDRKAWLIAHNLDPSTVENDYV